MARTEQYEFLGAHFNLSTLYHFRAQIARCMRNRLFNKPKLYLQIFNSHLKVGGEENLDLLVHSERNEKSVQANHTIIDVMKSPPQSATEGLVPQTRSPSQS